MLDMEPGTPLGPGQPVLIKLDSDKKWNKPAEVAGTDPDNHSYLVQTQEGTLYRRARKHLQNIPMSAVPPPDPDPVIRAEDFLPSPEEMVESGPPIEAVAAGSQKPVTPACPSTPGRQSPSTSSALKPSPVRYTSRDCTVILPQRYREA